MNGGKQEERECVCETERASLTGAMTLNSVSSSAFSMGALDSSTGGALTRVG